jgi:hypothetical protein
MTGKIAIQPEVGLDEFRLKMLAPYTSKPLRKKPRPWKSSECIVIKDNW